MSQIGMNLRVTEFCDQGGRKYMEDRYAVHFEKNDKGVVEFGYFGVFDGHGGAEAAKFARDRLLEEITKYDEFWMDDDVCVCRAIKTGFLDTHKAMWKERDKWPMTSSGFASTSGTTASIAIIKNCKLYVGHVGDSAIVLGQQEDPSPTIIGMNPLRLTKDHKPESPEEKERIERSGGCVMRKAGVNRVVWNRPKNIHKGPVRRSTHIDQIPFLAVARSLGDLWSYDYDTKEFVVSPEPDVTVRHLFPRKDRCLILGSDGLWNMLSDEDACRTVQCVEREVEKQIMSDPNVPLNHWVNVSEKLVQLALQKWRNRMMRADNTSAMVVMIDPLGPSRWRQLQKKREIFLNKLNLSNMANNNTLDNSSMSLTPDSERSDSPDFSREPDRNAPTPILNPNFVLPLTPNNASPSEDTSFDMPMDYDEVDGDLSIVSNSRLPTIGSEIVIGESPSLQQRILEDIITDNGHLDELEAEVMAENLKKNFKTPMKKKPTIPLLKTEKSFLTLTESPPSCLVEGETKKLEKVESVFNGKPTCPNSLKFRMPPLGSSPNLTVSDSPVLSVCPSNSKVHRPSSPPRLNPYTGRPAVRIIREYLGESDSHDQQNFLQPAIPGNHGDNVKEYLKKKNRDNSINVSMSSRGKHTDIPVVTKSKRFNVTIIREYLTNRSKKRRHWSKKKAKSFGSKTESKTIPQSSTNKMDSSQSSSFKAASENCRWTKWLANRTSNIRRPKEIKAFPTLQNENSSNVLIVDTADVRQRSSSLTNLSYKREKQEPVKSTSLTILTNTEQERKRSNSLSNVTLGHVLKIKNEENLLSSVKTRNSPNGFGASCSDLLGHSSHALTGKEQIDTSSPGLVRRILTRKTPFRCENRQRHQRSKSAPNIGQSLTRSRLKGLSKSGMEMNTKRTIKPTTSARVLRSLLGQKRKAPTSSNDGNKSKRFRTALKGRNS